VALPFANLSGDPAQDYLVDALTDELTTGLARITGSFVIARNTAFTYKGKPVDVRAIGKDLGVRYVLEGSVLPSGAQVRVNAQLIDAESGAQVWAEQFDTARADLLQMQDDIVTRLVRALEYELPEAAAARVKRTPAANPDAEDLAVQCGAAIRKAGFFGKDAEAGYHVCEQALAADPNNVRALATLSVKFWLPVAMGASADPGSDLERADQIVSKALALDPNYAYNHHFKAIILLQRRRVDEAIAENERAIALDPSLADAFENLGDDNTLLGRFEKSLEFYDRAIRLSPHDPGVFLWFSFKAFAYFGLRQYDQAIEWARRSIAINGNFAYARASLVAALSLSGHDTEAHEALQNYLAIPRNGPNTIAAWKAYWARITDSHSDPRILETKDRMIEGLRKAEMPEG
jgi:adenylate cyclase